MLPVHTQSAEISQPFKEAAALTTRNFKGAAEAVEAVFDVMYRVLQMRTLFLARFDRTNAAGRVDLSLNVLYAKDYEGCPVYPGLKAPLGNVF
jgi:hypothetical protein